MRTLMPRLVKDGKSGIWFFRWSLPKSHQQNLNQKTLYITLRTRDARLAQSHAALLNLRVEAMKKIPNLNEDAIRKLLEIDMERGIFRADTPEEQERGLQILENLGRLRASTPQQNNAPALRPTPAMTPKSPLFRAVADELIREISLTLKKASVDKYRSTYDAFREHAGTLGWNTFPIPTLTEQNKADLTACAEAILLAREAHFPATIADLYDPETMPENLRMAHERNDEVLERIYIGRRFKNDTERLEKLFDLYTKMTATTGSGKKGKKK